MNDENMVFSVSFPEDRPEGKVIICYNKDGKEIYYPPNEVIRQTLSTLWADHERLHLVEKDLEMMKEFARKFTSDLRKIRQEKLILLAELAEYKNSGKVLKAYGKTLEELEKLGWPCRLEELPQLYMNVCEEVNKLRSQLPEAARNK